MGGRPDLGCEDRGSVLVHSMVWCVEQTQWPCFMDGSDVVNVFLRGCVYMSMIKKIFKLLLLFLVLNNVLK